MLFLEEILNHCRETLYPKRNISKLEFMLKDPLGYISNSEYDAGMFNGDNQKKFCQGLSSYNWYESTPTMCLNRAQLAVVMGIHPKDYKPSHIEFRMWNKYAGTEFDYSQFYKKWVKFFPSTDHCDAWIEWARSLVTKEVCYNPLHFDGGNKNHLLIDEQDDTKIVLSSKHCRYVRLKAQIRTQASQQLEKKLNSDTWLHKTAAAASNSSKKKSVPTEESKGLKIAAAAAVVSGIQ